MTGNAVEVRGHEPVMTIARAITLVACAAEGDCFPSCPHCTASQAEVEAARTWLDEHPDEEEAWAVSQLAGIMSELRHWTAGPAASNPGADPWRVMDGDATIVAGLTQEQADAVVRQHNRQVTAALGRLDEYLGA